MILLDSNVVSELWLPRPDPSVHAWLNSQLPETLCLCAPVLAELRYGIERLPQSARRTRLEDAFERLAGGIYRNRILSFDSEAALEFGRLVAARERLGRQIEPMVAIIAAIAASHGASLATRDINDFEGLGLDLIDPFVYRPG
jgi:toxin FitB